MRAAGAGVRSAREHGLSQHACARSPTRAAARIALRRTAREGGGANRVARGTRLDIAFRGSVGLLEEVAMKIRTLIPLVVLAALASTVPARAAMQSSSSLSVGAGGGIGAEGSVTAYDVAQGFPFSVRFGVSLLSLDPGDAVFARRVFVNEATNGSPEKSGHRWDFRLDLRRPLHGARDQGIYAFAGPRLSLFRSTFTYAGGNEVFDVITNQWGFGGGFEGVYPMGPSVALNVQLGADLFANAPLIGHDSTYAPDGTIVNGKEDFSYKSADQAISQPRLVPRIMVGISHRLMH